MAGDYILDAVPAGKLVQGEVWVLERHVNYPGWPVGDDNLQRFLGMGFQVCFKENQFLGPQFLRPAVVQNREVCLSVIETVV
jgi:hypothetical protein